MHATPTPQECTLDALVARIPDGARVALGNEFAGCPMAAARALAARRVRGLALVGVPVLGLAADMLIGAGCVAEVETAAVTLGEHGPAGRFCAAVADGAIALRDATCPAIHAGLQAAEKGIPFMPIRGILGSDLVANRPDWKVIDNPFAQGAGDPILLVPALRPDVALIHAALGDRHGNVWVGVHRELMLMAHAAAETLCTVERIVDDDLMADEALKAGAIPALYVGALTEVKGGAAPVGLTGHYPPDHAALKAYAAAARSQAGFDAWFAGAGAMAAS